MMNQMPRTQTIQPAPVRRSIRVNAAPEKAFEVFTSGMSRWWIKSHSINKSPLKEVIMEPRAGGRWYEIGEDGSQCEWGKVLAWEPPGRLLIAWQVNGQWQFDPAIVTEVEVRFVPDGEGTQVELEHRHLERLGVAAEQTRAALDSAEGWQGLLERFAQATA
jgi:uncharacterized protein YndB with AHSA1/START domain